MQGERGRWGSAVTSRRMAPWRIAMLARLSSRSNSRGSGSHCGQSGSIQNPRMMQQCRIRVHVPSLTTSIPHPPPSLPAAASRGGGLLQPVGAPRILGPLLPPAVRRVPLRAVRPPSQHGWSPTRPRARLLTRYFSHRLRSLAGSLTCLLSGSHTQPLVHSYLCPYGSLSPFHSLTHSISRSLAL